MSVRRPPDCDSALENNLRKYFGKRLADKPYTFSGSLDHNGLKYSEQKNFGTKSA